MNRALPYRLCRSSGRVRWWLLWRRHQAYSRCGCGRVPAQCEYPRWFCWRESPGTLVRSVSSRLCGRGVWRLPQRHLPHMYVCMDVYNEPAEARATCISGDPAWPKGGSLGPMRCCLWQVPSARGRSAWLSAAPLCRVHAHLRRPMEVKGPLPCRVELECPTRRQVTIGWDRRFALPSGKRASGHANRALEGSAEF